VVGHQHIGVQAHAGFLQAFPKPVSVGLVVLFSKKAGRAVMAALDDVMREISDMQAGATWHAKEYRRNKSNLTPLIVYIDCSKMFRPKIPNTYGRTWPLSSPFIVFASSIPA